MKNENVKERLVRVISLDKRYRSRPFPAVAPEDQKLGIFLTGQQRVNGDEFLGDGLTFDEMIGKKEITPKSRYEKYYPVIDPMDVYPLLHGRTFDLTMINNMPRNPKDFWEYMFFMGIKTSAGDNLVALSKNKYVNRKNYFYVEDKEAEAIEIIEEINAYHSAIDFVKTQVSVSQFNDLALLLNHRVPNFSIDIEILTPNQIQAALYQAAKDHPEEVISCNPDFNPNIKKQLFVLKLVKHQIITFEEGVGFYDGSFFVGSTLKECVFNLGKEKYATYVDKWGKQLNSREKGVEIP